MWHEQKYISIMGGYLEGFRDLSRNLWTFRCPFCGDSKTNEFKTRGYFFKNGDNYFFKCHNCGRSENIYSFIKAKFPQYLSEFMVDSLSYKERPKRKEKDEENFKSVYKPRDKPVKTVLTGLETCEMGNEGRVYLEGRQIAQEWFKGLYYTPCIHDTLVTIDEYRERAEKSGNGFPMSGGIIIPYYSDQGVLEFIQFRNLDENSKLRYLTAKIEPDSRKIWNLPNIKKDETLWVFEGAFDAMFTSNCCSVGGADIIETVKYLEELGCKDVRAVWDADWATNPEVYKRLVKAIEASCKVVISLIADLGEKDINKAVMEGFDRTKVEDYLEARTFSSLEAMLELSKYPEPKPKKKIENGKKKTSSSFPEFRPKL